MPAVHARLIVGLLVVSAAVGCNLSESFACSDDASCDNGWCEINGYCSFPDDACETGRRFSEFSGPFSGECVPTDFEPTSGSSTATSGVEPTTTSGPSTTSGGSTTGTTDPGTTSPSTSGPTSATGTTTSTSDTTDDPTTGSQGCQVGEVCLPDAPDGWAGPVLLEPSCEGAPAFEAAESFAGAWSCGCNNCEVEAADTCGALAVGIEFFSDSNCEGPPEATDTISTGCEAFDVAGSYYVRLSNAEPAACTIDTQPQLGKVNAVGTTQACDMPTGAACDGGTCGDTGACIWREGEFACPDTTFTSQTILYGGYEDTRGCGACSCDATFSCGASANVATEGATCGALQSVSLQVGVCSDFITPVAGTLTSNTGTPWEVCEAIPGAQQGAVELTQPVTVCCLG